jgi:glutamine amidotransferase
VAADAIVIDHGAGNLGSVVRALGRQGAEVLLSSDPDRIATAKRLVLPGDGHFGEAMRALRARGLEAPLRCAVASGTWLLGICVGLQMLFRESDEAADTPGLGLLPGRVRRFDSRLRVPHIGWNQLEGMGDRGLFRGVPEGGYAYFLHSFYADPDEARHRLAATEYGIRFASAAGEGRVLGIQFHPEKSGRLGAAVLRNFLAVSGGAN